MKIMFNELSTTKIKVGIYLSKFLKHLNFYL